jgi:protein-ribulosamine 3-kinase
MRFLEAALGGALGKTGVIVRHKAPAARGCIHQAHHLTTSEGEFFAKWSSSCPEDIFLREAEGLEALRARKSDLVVPAAVAASGPQGDDPAYLILEYLPPAGRAGVSDDETLGRGLATIHRGSADAFGFASHTYCGLTRQDNRWTGSWAEFYAERRLGLLLVTLDGRGALSIADRRTYERLFDRLPDLLPNRSTPSLIHGDLWSGNVLSTERGPALVDPSCSYADREMEFGITTLFGGLSPRGFAAYEEAWPLPAGWRDRNPLYQLYHLLNHAVLFGGGYAEDARRIAARYAG